MKVGILSSYDAEGGAGRAAHRLHQALAGQGVDSHFRTMFKTSDDHSVEADGSHLARYTSQLRGDLDRLPVLFYRKRQKKFFSTGLLRNQRVVDWANQMDVVNIHWVGVGFLGIRSISRISKPIVLTLHDAWGFTGGCHVLGPCTRYQDSCGRCPQLGSNSDHDLSRFTLQRKLRHWGDRNFSVVTDGRWLSERARESRLFARQPISVVNPGLDLDVFKPVSKLEARKLLNIAPDTKLILFGAVGAMSDENKGYQHLAAALKRLAQSGLRSQIQIAIFGAGRPRGEARDELFRTHYLGALRDTLSLPVIYSAADVMVVPSLQEAFGQTASESLACGTPVVAFDATGLRDSVDHLENGFLAQPYQPESLAEGIEWVLSDSARWHTLSQAARAKAERNFGLPRYADQYLNVYRQAAAMQAGAATPP